MSDARLSAESAAGSSFSYSEFTPVKRKLRKNRRHKTPLPLSPLVLTALGEQLRQEEWFAHCSQLIERDWNQFSTRIPAILCLGLGSPSASPIARIQLAFLAETCKQLNVAHDAISVYDPVFTPEDIALFDDLKMRVLRQSKSADYALRAPTICFMPHCDIELYEALLRANWSRAGLDNLFLLGNQLQEYIDNKPTSALEATAPCLLRAAPLFEAHPLPPSSTWPTAFNNTAVQFRLAGEATLSDDVFESVSWRDAVAEAGEASHAADASDMDGGGGKAQKRESESENPPSP